MTRWFPIAALLAVLSPLALCDDGGESVRPCAKPFDPAKCCPAKTDQAAKPCCASRAAPEDERQAYLEMITIIRTTHSPDTFTAVVAGLLGADSAEEKRYARLAVPVVIRNAERLGLLKGIASAEEPTPAQAELIDYLEGAPPEPPPVDAMPANYGVPLRGRSYFATGMYSPTPPAMPAPGSYAPYPTIRSAIPAAAPEPVPPTMYPAVEEHSRPAAQPPAAIPTPAGVVSPTYSPPTPAGAR
jgi:hypothetical protein